MNVIPHPPSSMGTQHAGTARFETTSKRKRQNQTRVLLSSLLLSLLINNIQSRHGGLVAAEALITPALHHRSFLLHTRGGSHDFPHMSSSSHIQSSIFPEDAMNKKNKRDKNKLQSAVATNGSDSSVEDFSSEGEETKIMLLDEEELVHVDSSMVSSSFRVPPEQHLTTRFVAETNLPTKIGMFRLRAYRICSSVGEEAIGEFVGKEPVVIYAKDRPPGLMKGDGKRGENVPVRIHDQCFTSEVFGSRRCDCREQLEMAIEYVHENGGAVIYLQQEGRGIGIANKIAAYALQDRGFDTVDANTHLGFPEDCRQYGVVPSMLADLGIDSIRLMTNNPRKLERLATLDINVTGTVPMVVTKANKYNRRYLETKRSRMNHKNFGSMLSLDNDDVTSQVIHGVNDPKITAVSLDDENQTPTITAVSLEDEKQSGVNAAADGYCFGKQSVEDAIAAVARGELVVVVDDENRENEGDFICAADICTAENMAQITRYSSGVICVGMEGERMDELELPAMVSNNQDPKGTAFSVTVDATEEHGITTGISARDRSTTVRLLADMKTEASDFHRPGHIFPLRAKQNGVLDRDGHTEAAVDLSRLAGRSPVGVLCEIVSEEHPTEMARLPELKRFCRKHGFVLTSIVDIAQYRRDMEQ